MTDSANDCFSLEIKYFWEDSYLKYKRLKKFLGLKNKAKEGQL